MNRFAEAFFTLVILLWWLSGIVLAKGFWMSALAIGFPPYALYLVVERLIHIFLP